MNTANEDESATTMTPAEDFDPDEFAIVMLITIVLLSIGVAFVFTQCRKLVKTIHEYRSQKKKQQQKPMSASEMKKLTTDLRNKHGQTRKELEEELRGMKIVQKEVKAKLRGLETLVENVLKQQQTMNEQHDENMSRLKMQ